jgi:hypothetical protein
MNKHQNVGRSAFYVVWATSTKFGPRAGNMQFKTKRMINEQVCMYVCIIKQRFLPARFSMRHVQQNVIIVTGRIK